MQVDYLVKALGELDANDAVERYAWFAPLTTDFAWIGAWQGVVGTEQHAVKYQTQQWPAKQKQWAASRLAHWLLVRCLPSRGPSTPAAHATQPPHIELTHKRPTTHPPTHRAGSTASLLNPQNTSSLSYLGNFYNEFVSPVMWERGTVSGSISAATLEVDPWDSECGSCTEALADGEAPARFLTSRLLYQRSGCLGLDMYRGAGRCTCAAMWAAWRLGARPAPAPHVVTSAGIPRQMLHLQKDSIKITHPLLLMAVWALCSLARCAQARR